MFHRTLTLALAISAGAISMPVSAAYSQLGALEIVNNTVNAIPFRDDIELYGVKDYWATPEEFFENNGGDCEDYAIAKRQALLKALPGVTALVSHVYATNAATRGVKTAHMVLLVEYEGLWWVLDNLVDEILPYNERPDLEWVYGFDDKGVVVFNPSSEGLGGKPVEKVAPCLRERIAKVLKVS